MLSFDDVEQLTHVCVLEQKVMQLLQRSVVWPHECSAIVILILYQCIGRVPA